MATVALTAETFEETVLAPGITIIDFWADWCGPCKQIAPALEELSDELAGKVTIAKLNTDDFPEVASKFGIRGIPTMILFKDGKQHATKVGAQPKSAIKGWIESEIA